MRGWLLLAITAAGCVGGGPPLEELPLRDALRAQPDVVAAMPDGARGQLAARLQAAGARDTSSDPVETSGVAAAELVAQADGARQRRSADALVIGLIGGGAAQALPAGSQASVATALPPLEGAPATDTAGLEARALAGAAGASLRELLAASRATRLQRVVGWPVAATAIADTVYVNAAWLVALAPASLDGGPADAGDAGPETTGSMFAGGRAGSSNGFGAGAGGAAGRAGRGLAGSPGGEGGVGGAGGRPRPGTGGSPVIAIPTWSPPPPPPPSTSDNGNTADNAAAAADGCATLADACAASGDGSEGDSCGSQDSGSTDSCGGSSSDYGSSDTACQTAPGRQGTRPATIVWLFAPLLYLWRPKP